MVEISLPADRIEAGTDYLLALRSLGLEPEGLAWVRVDDRPQWLLLLATSFYDVAGPLELNKLLFAAYNRGLLPASIDPFDVDAYSPDQELFREINGILWWQPRPAASSSTLARRWDRLKSTLGRVAA